MGVLLTKKQASIFILLKHGLIGDYKFEGKNGILDFVAQAGCIQYDPIDICGKNSELVLQSRVKGFSKQMLYSLLYEDRKLIDYFDKNLSIIRIEDWPYFWRDREAYRTGGRSRDEVNAVCEEIKNIIRERGPVSSSDIGFNEKVYWYWSDTKLSRAALETMYFRGDLIVHHKKGTVKYYDLAEKYIDAELLNSRPHSDDFEHLKWRVMRRIGAVGLMWNKPSDAWLNIDGLKASARNEVFAKLLDEGKITEIGVEGIKDKFYILKTDENLVETVLENPEPKARCELIAPLDNLLWDRKHIKALFDFDYKWEVYTPKPQRKYGYYVLPLLYGDRFIGRAEAIRNSSKGALEVKNIWYEDGFIPDDKARKDIEKCFERFADFNECNSVIFSETC